MRTPVLVLVVLGLVGLVAALPKGDLRPEADRPDQRQANAVPATLPTVAAAKAEIAIAELRKEPQIIDLLYSPQEFVEWTAGVKGDGSPRFGYAEYLCLRLQELGARTDETTVRIVDYKRYMAPGGNSRDASLGTVECRTGEHITP